jgi:hypothetical protein
MHLCYDFVSPKLSCLDPNIIKSAEIQSQAIEFAQRNLLLVQGNLLWTFLYVAFLPLTSYCKDCPVGPNMDIAKENSTKTLWT